MSEADVTDEYRPYREEIRRRVCAVCLDGADDGSCALAHPPACALEEHLPRLVDTIRDVAARQAGEYAATVEARVCSRCLHRDELGRCRLRRDGRCAVSVYLPLVVEAVLAVDDARPRGVSA